MWDSSKQDTFWDGRGVSGAFGKYYLFITSWLDNDSSKKKKKLFPINSSKALSPHIEDLVTMNSRERE